MVDRRPGTSACTAVAGCEPRDRLANTRPHPSVCDQLAPKPPKVGGASSSPRMRHVRAVRTSSETFPSRRACRCSDLDRGIALKLEK
jgi:hypothetical protein